MEPTYVGGIQHRSAHGVRPPQFEPGFGKFSETAEQHDGDYSAARAVDRVFI